MADTEIPDLTGATTPLDGTEEIHIVQGVNSRMAAVSEIANLVTVPIVSAATFYNDVGGALIGSAARKDALLDKTLTNSAPSNFVLASNIVTIAEAGIYYFSYAYLASVTTGTRHSLSIFLQRDPLGVGSFADIPGSEAGGYVRSTAPRTGPFGAVTLQIAATDKIKLQGLASGQNITTDGSSLSILKLASL